MMFEAPIENAALVALAVGFISFVVYCRIRNIFALEAYYSTVGKTHLAFAALTLSGFLAWCFVTGMGALDTFLHAGILTFLFFFLHYAFFHQIIGLIKKSVSLNILMLVEKKSGLGIEQILQAYGDGRGTDFLVDNRVHQMLSLTWIEKIPSEKKDDRYRITARGLKIARFYNSLKWFFALRSPLENGRR